MAERRPSKIIIRIDRIRDELIIVVTLANRDVPGTPIPMQQHSLVFTGAAIETSMEVGIVSEKTLGEKERKREVTTKATKLTKKGRVIGF